jgi:site-specific DNA recombinase
VTTMHVGMLGTMAQMFLADLREKTKRGQLGRVLQGRAAAGEVARFV